MEVNAESKTYTICIVSSKSTSLDEYSVLQLIDYWNTTLSQEQDILLRLVHDGGSEADIYLFLVSDHIDESKLVEVINNPDPIVIFCRTSGSSKSYELNTVNNKFHGRCAFVDHSSPNDFSAKLLDLIRHTANR